MSRRTVAFTGLLCFLSLISCCLSNLHDILFSGDYELIDLTHPFDNSTVYWPNTRNFEFIKKIEEERVHGWYAAKEFAAGEHGGTHIDAPYHFKRTGQQVADIPLEKLIVSLVIVDISSKVNDDPNFVLFPSHLSNLNLNDTIKNLGEPCLIIFKFGWSKYFNDRRKYLGITDDDRMGLNFPGLTSAVVEWIVLFHKNVVGIGVDVASVDPGNDVNYSVHKMLANASIYGIENVNLNQHVPEYGCTALALPMKIAEGTGAPLRLVAICPKQKPTSF